MMEQSSPQHGQPQEPFYTCIASDSLFTSDGSIVNAQLSAKLEIGQLHNREGDNCSLFSRRPSLDRDSNGATTKSTWQSQGSPQAALIAIQNCKLWFLFTDGKQEDGEDENFNRRVERLGVEGYPCVFVLFGSSSDGPPPNTQFHVCAKTYSSAPNALFLFHDVGTDQIYIFHAKGCFAKLSDGRPTIQHNWEGCKWFQLQRFRYEKLLAIKLPSPQPGLVADRLTIHNGTVLTNGEYRAMKAAADVGARFDLRRLQEIINKAGEKDTFKPQYWKPSQPSSTVERVDIDGQASHAVRGILMNLDHKSMGIDVPESRIDGYREDLRAANKANRLAFEQALVKKEMEDLEEKQKSRESFLLPVVDPHEIFFPGFVRGPVTIRQHSEFRGACMFCHEEDVMLAFLLHRVELVNVDSLRVTGLPLVFNNMLVCDACAVHCRPDGLMEPKVAAVLPLVSVIDNEAAWTEVFDTVIGSGVGKEDILLSVWNWLSTQLGYEVEELKPVSYKEALEWVLKDLGKWEDITRNRRFDTKIIRY
ncbi:uncharacterized protein LY89DRAFT_759871 [Mollisia scopiformis]|uniref:Uncharacterized protein n=1 Tax=Mollisia scopiformis TaxID=149040 RepID=A0A194WSH0_MOLSC|nr:uncharacterized protein LY89DRAFT_759871 [Mollisia scopiformis]KUJ10910.1 hypothetical protein LY89DRAFT_759871 [Mollisia scopiformis]